MKSLKELNISLRLVNFGGPRNSWYCTIGDGNDFASGAGLTPQQALREAADSLDAHCAEAIRDAVSGMEKQ